MVYWVIVNEAQRAWSDTDKIYCDVGYTVYTDYQRYTLTLPAGSRWVRIYSDE